MIRIKRTYEAPARGDGRASVVTNALRLRAQRTDVVKTMTPVAA